MTKWRVTYKMAELRQMTKNKTLAFIKRNISQILNEYIKSFLSRPENIQTWTVMTENVSKVCILIHAHDRHKIWLGLGHIWMWPTPRILWVTEFLRIQDGIGYHNASKQEMSLATFRCGPVYIKRLAMATLHANIRSRPTEEFLNCHETRSRYVYPAWLC